MEHKYNYVIFDDNEDSFYKDTLLDFYKLSNVKVVNPPLSDKSGLVRLLFKIHVSEKTAKIIKLPFKRIWRKHLFKNTFLNSKPMCFMFCNSLYKLRWTGFFEYLKKEYPGCKLVYYCRDLFKYCFSRYKRFEPEYLYKTFDYVLTYDMKDSIKYGLTFYSDFETIHDSPISCTIDNKVVFVGAARDRLDTILNVFRLLKSKGVKCDFYVTGVPKEKRFVEEGIVFADKWLDYKEVIKKVMSSSCVLEVIQGDSYGYSARAMKAIGYNKKLITNSLAVKHTRFYKQKGIVYFNDIENIDVDFIKNGKMPNYHYMNEFSPISIISYMEYLFCGGTPEDFYCNWFNLVSYKNEILNIEKEIKL